jgi:hypothetical protein
MKDLNQVEQELTELQKKLEKSFGVLDSLAQIQTQFEGLSQTYQKFKEYLEKVKTSPESPQSDAKINQRLKELENITESRLIEIRSELLQVGEKTKVSIAEIAAVKQSLGNRCNQIETLTQSIWSQVKDELLKTQNQVDTANSNLRDQVFNQTSTAKREIEGSIAAVLQQWVNQRDALDATIARLEEKIEQQNDAGCNPENIRKLDSRSQRNKLSLNDIESQVKRLQFWLSIASAIAIISGSISLYLLIFGTEKQPTPEQNTTEESPQPEQSQLPYRAIPSRWGAIAFSLNLTR